MILGCNEDLLGRGEIAAVDPCFAPLAVTAVRALERGALLAGSDEDLPVDEVRGVTLPAPELRQLARVVHVLNAHRDFMGRVAPGGVEGPDPG